MPKGRHPKPAELRQNRTKKAGATELHHPGKEQEKKPKPPTLQNPDKRKFHRLTRAWWKRVWESPMASEYLPTDVDGLNRLAILVDNYNNNPDAKTLAEIRLQESRFGLSPLDRSRLQWEVSRGEEAERKRRPPKKEHEPSEKDPRGILGEVK